MRRTVVQETQEETAPARLSVPPQSEEKIEQTLTTSQPVARKPARGPGRALRGGIVLFSALGLFTVLVPSITGVPLNEWLAGANFQAAYSGSNLHFMRGSAALKMGNISGAMSALMALSPESTEAHDLASELFPIVLNSGDYVTGVRICQHLAGTRSTTNLSIVSLQEIGTHLTQNLGVREALARVEKEPELRAQSAQIIPAIFAALINSTQITNNKSGSSEANRALLLEELEPALTGLSKTEAIKALSTLYTNANQPRPAWEWSLKLPAAEKRVRQKEIVQRFSHPEPRVVLGWLQTLGAGAEQDVLRVEALQGVLTTLPAEAPRLLASIQTPEQRQLALKVMVRNGNIPLKDRLALLDQIKDLKLKMESLVFMNQQSSPMDVEQLIMPKFTAFVRQHPEYIQAHDAMLRYLAVRTMDRNAEERFINAMLNPATRTATLQERNEGRLVEATIPWENGRTNTLRRQATPR